MLVYYIAIAIQLQIALAASLATVPALFLSYHLIPGLKPSLTHSEQIPFTEHEANVYLTRALEACNSEHYIFVKVPGLKVEDFQQFPRWHNLRSRLSAASTFLSMPNIISDHGFLMPGKHGANSAVHWNALQETLELNCQVRSYEVNSMDPEEVPRIIHTEKTLVEINAANFLIDLEEQEQRGEFITRIDELIRRICQKFPTPYVSVLIAGTVPGGQDKKTLYNQEDVITFDKIPDDPRVLTVEMREQVKTSKRFIFPDVTVFDKSRYFEHERNDNGERHRLGDLKDNEWAKDVGKEKTNPDDIDVVDDTWLEKKTKKIVKDPKEMRYGEDEEFHSAFESKQFIKDNAVAIACCFLFLFTFVLLDVLRLVLRVTFAFLKRFFSSNAAKSKKRAPLKVKNTKSD
jgi:hypothetical protein